MIFNLRNKYRILFVRMMESHNWNQLDGSVRWSVGQWGRESEVALETPSVEEIQRLCCNRPDNKDETRGTLTFFGTVKHWVECHAQSCMCNSPVSKHSKDHYQQVRYRPSSSYFHCRRFNRYAPMIIRTSSTCLYYFLANNLPAKQPSLDVKREKRLQQTIHSQQAAPPKK